MLHNRSALLTAGLAAVAYFLFTRLKKADKKEVAEYIEKSTTSLMEKRLTSDH